MTVSLDAAPANVKKPSGLSPAHGTNPGTNTNTNTNTSRTACAATSAAHHKMLQTNSLIAR